MIDPVDRAVRAVSRRNSYALVWLQFGLAHLVMLAGMGLLRLYQPMSAADFWWLVAISQGLALADNLVSVRETRMLWRPVSRWEAGSRDPASTLAAWQALATLPIEYLRSSLRDLQRATDRVRAGDFSTRVPVVATDETGTLALSFNTMITGLDERERLRTAFGAYVDPGLAERVLAEGADLAGKEVEVSILFLDIRAFTRLTEASEPHEVVALLNELWELAVPVLRRHGGHANKFIGDGLLGVLGAPESLQDHAANAVEAATRETGDAVLITEETRRLLPKERFDLDERPAVELKGKQVQVQLWAPRVRQADAFGRDPARATVPD